MKISKYTVTINYGYDSLLSMVADGLKNHPGKEKFSYTIHTDRVNNEFTIITYWNTQGEGELEDNKLWISDLVTFCAGRKALKSFDVEHSS